ncbi:MAG: O-antigen ligase family protein [Candidatus Omnitrophota bacterium]
MNIPLPVIIIGLVIAILILANPFIGLAITTILLSQVILQAFGQSIFGLFTMATPIKIIGGLTFLSAFMKQFLERKSWVFLKKPQVKFFLLFIIWIYISGFTHPGFATRENFTMFTSFFMLGFIILSLVNNIRRFRIILWTELICMFLISLYSIYIYLNSKQGMRISGADYGPNEFAISLLPILGISFYTFFTKKGAGGKILSLIIAFTIFSALVLTFSRGGLIGFLGLLFIALIKTRRKIATIIFAIVIVAGLASFMPSDFWERIEKTRVEEKFIGDPTVDSTTRRYMLSKAAWQMFLDNPIFGRGIGNYYYECRNYQPLTAGRAHNMYLEVMAELGIVGLVFMLGIFFTTMKALNRIVKKNKELANYAKGFYIGLFGFFISAVFLHAEHDKILWFMIFMAAALENIALSNNRAITNKAIYRKQNAVKI